MREHRRCHAGGAHRTSRAGRIHVVRGLLLPGLAGGRGPDARFTASAAHPRAAPAGSAHSVITTVRSAASQSPANSISLIMVCIYPRNMGAGTHDRGLPGWGYVVAPGVAGFELEDLAGAVDGEQRAELSHVAGQRDIGE